MVFIKLLLVMAEIGLVLNTTPNLKKQKMYNFLLDQDQLLLMVVEPFPCGSVEKRSKAFTLCRQECEYRSCIFANLQMIGSQKKPTFFLLLLLDKWYRVVLPLDSLRTLRDMNQLFWKLQYCFYCSPCWDSSGRCVFRRHVFTSFLFSFFNSADKFVITVIGNYWGKILGCCTQHKSLLSPGGCQCRGSIFAHIECIIFKRVI